MLCIRNWGSLLLTKPYLASPQDSLTDLLWLPNACLVTPYFNCPYCLCLHHRSQSADSLREAVSNSLSWSQGLMESQFLSWFSVDISWMNEWMNENTRFNLLSSVFGQHSVFFCGLVFRHQGPPSAWDPSTKNQHGPIWGLHRIWELKDSWRTLLVVQCSRICLPCQCRGHRLDPWSGKTLHAEGQLGPWATTTDLVCRNYWSLHA